MTDKKVIITPVLFPEMGWIKLLEDASTIYIDGTERFQKQTSRSRYSIATSAGPLMLTVPVKQGKTQLKTGEVLISYEEPWARKHLRSIKTAYGSAPYYIYYADELEDLLQQPHERLLDLQMQMLGWLLKCFRKSCMVLEWTDLNLPENIIDLRFQEIKPVSPYPQVFDSQNGFLQGMAAFDYLFNEGPEIMY